MVVFRSVRQVRSRRVAARPQGLQGSLRRLSLAELYRVPQYRRSRRSRVFGGAGEVVRCRIQDQGRSQRPGRHVRAARPARRLLPPAVPQRPGHAIKMPKPLSDGQVTFDDGSPATVAQYARDVTTFLMWAAEPHMEARKRLGFQVFVFLIIFAGLMYFTKKKVWAEAH